MEIKFTDHCLISSKYQRSKRLLLMFVRTFILLFCTTVFSFNITASTSSVQEKVLITSDTEATVDEVFQIIINQTKYNFLYPEGIFKTLPKVQLKKGVISADKLINQSLSKGVFNVVLSKTNTILIKELKTRQNIQVSGIVSDNNGLPLPGVNVYIKGTKKGTITNFDGFYKISVANPENVLVFTYLGYEQQEIEVGNQTEINVVLNESVSVLNSVVITALGIKKKEKSLTYSVQELKSESLTDGGQGNIINSLSGKVAGVDIQSSAGGVGLESRVILRGTSSITGNNNALYVVDGIPVPDLTLSSNKPNGFYGSRATSFGGISMLNSEDIESISVLTGAAAAALYGTQAANGVILMNTKKGSGKLKISLSNSISLMSPFVTPKFQNSYGNEPGSIFSWGEKLVTPSDYNPLDFFQTGSNEKTSFSLSTGSSTNKFYFSAARQNAKGIIPNNDFSRINLTLSNSYKFLKNLIDLDVSVNYIKQQDKNIILQGQYENPLVPIYLFPPGDKIEKYKIYERLDPERNITTQYWPYGDQGLAMQNPYWIINRNLFKNNIERYLIGGSLKLNLMKDLSITGRARLDNSYMKSTKKLYASTYQLFAGNYGAYSVSPSHYQAIYADLVASYNKRFNDIIGLNTNIGTSIKDDQFESVSAGGDIGQIANFFVLGGISSSKIGIGETGFHDQMQSIFSNISLDYDNKIFLEASGRIDWPSQLYGATQSSFFYPNIGSSAIITDLLNVKSNIFSFVKIRGSYSEVGNAPPRYTTGLTYPLSGGQISNTTIRPSKNIEPERTKSVEVGMDLRFFNGKVSLNGTLYKAKTLNQLFTPNLSTSSGFNSFYLNAGEVENKGIEASLSWKGNLALAGKLKLNSTVTYSLNKNKVVKLVKDYVDEVTGETITEDRLVFGSTGSYRTILTEGGTMGDIYVNTLKKDGQGFIFVSPSDAKIFADPDNFIKAGTSLPNYRLGWKNELSYKDIKLSFLVNARIGGVGVSQTQAILDYFGVSQASVNARENGGVILNSTNYSAKDFFKVVGSPQAGVGAYYVYDMTNVRLKEVSLSYKLDLPKISFLDNLQIGVNGYNLFMIYNKAPFDPESTSSIGTFYQGIDYFMQPSLRSISCNLKLEF